MNEKLQLFLLRANTRCYGSAAINQEKLSSGEKIITFAQDEFEFKDVYYGGEPYAGQEVIFAGGCVVWAMQYRGRIEPGEDFAPIYGFLGRVLTGTKIGLPRGVDGARENQLSYNFKMDGDLDEFSARETISRNGAVVYSAEFLGGLVDVRREEQDEIQK